MLRKLLILALAGALGAWMLAACDDGGDGDGDVDGDVDGDTDADGDGDWTCPQASASAPQLRLTSVQIATPAALANAIVQAILDDSLDNFLFIWLVDADLTAGTMATGSGAGDVAEFCSATWNPDYPPARDNPITVTGDSFSTSAPIPLVNIPVYSESTPDTPLLILPISQLEVLDVELNADRTLVGTPGAAPGSTRYSVSWNEAGRIVGWIAVEAARDVLIEDLGRTLCGLLSGDRPVATDPSQDCTSDMADWPNQPAEIPGSGGTMGYQMTADIGAGAITIQ